MNPPLMIAFRIFHLIVIVVGLYFASVGLLFLLAASGHDSSHSWTLESSLVTWIAPVAVPVAVGAAVVWFSRRSPTFGPSPAWTTLGLLPVLLVLAALSSPGGDLLGATVGGMTAIVVAVAVYIALRHRTG